MKSVKLNQAIKNLSPEAQFTITGDDLSNLVWLDETIEKPSDEEIMAEYNRIVDLAEPELSVEEKLAFVGLNVNDLKAALGLG